MAPALAPIRDLLTSFSPSSDFLALSSGDGRIKVRNQTPPIHAGAAGVAASSVNPTVCLCRRYGTPCAATCRRSSPTSPRWRSGRSPRRSAATSPSTTPA
uniref:Uncharacterized protein n=1 Tax=Aegilops tauschii subsp. strangulata TaxID=200361 RepID=A0A453I9N1_AEGTS